MASGGSGICVALWCVAEILSSLGLYVSFEKSAKKAFTKMSMDLSTRIRLVELYFSCGESVAKARRAFCRETGRKRAPSASSIQCLVNRFHVTGSVKKASKRIRSSSKKKERAAKKIRQAVEEEKGVVSTRRLSRRAKVPRTTVQRVMQEDLGLYPYKLQLTQKLKRGDKTMRRVFCKWLLQQCEAEPDFVEKLFMSDEANFPLDGVVNKQNCRIWSTENPHMTEEEVQFPPSVTVWCGISTRGIVGPYFFEEGGHKVTVNAKRYQAMLRSFLLPELKRRRIPVRKLWFQQDGATPHTSPGTIKVLNEFFKERLISKKGSVNWPPRSPDLTAPDFFLWGYVKSQVYATRPATLKQLKRRIRACIEAIPSSMRVAALREGLLRRCKECLHRRGGHLEDVIF